MVKHKAKSRHDFVIDEFLEPCIIFCNFFADGNATAAHSRITSLVSSMVSKANQVYLTSEFYGQGTRIHRGVRISLTETVIDRGSQCMFKPRYLDCLIEIK